MKRIQKLYDENTTVQQLQSTADSGASLPGLVIIRGVVSADGGDVKSACPTIDGVKSLVGSIDQPHNRFIEIATLAKSMGPNKVTDQIAKQTGIKPEDIPDVANDYEHAVRKSPTDLAIVLSEVLVARLCVSTSKTEKDGKAKIHRHPRAKSYCCFYSRKVADGLHLLDMQGARIEMKLPSADNLPQHSPMLHGEAPSLFLPTANVMEEFFSFLRKDGLMVQGKKLDLANLPPSELTYPDTLLSKFIFIDTQSTSDTGVFGGSPAALPGIGTAYGGQFLWEPHGFYDSCEPEWVENKQSELVSAQELLNRGRKAAQLNTSNTKYCEPTFSRDELARRRDEENCFRVTELAIPRGSDVTVLARPVKTAQGKVMLVPPNDAEEGADVDNPDSQRSKVGCPIGKPFTFCVVRARVVVRRWKWGFRRPGLCLFPFPPAGSSDVESSESK